MTHNREQGTKYKSFLLEGNGNPQLKYNYKFGFGEPSKQKKLTSSFIHYIFIFQTTQVKPLN